MTSSRSLENISKFSEKGGVDATAKNINILRCVVEMAVGDNFRLKDLSSFKFSVRDFVNHVTEFHGIEYTLQRAEGSLNKNDCILKDKISRGQRFTKKRYYLVNIYGGTVVEKKRKLIIEHYRKMVEGLSVDFSRDVVSTHNSLMEFVKSRLDFLSGDNFSDLLISYRGHVGHLDSVPFSDDLGIHGVKVRLGLGHDLSGSYSEWVSDGVEPSFGFRGRTLFEFWSSEVVITMEGSSNRGKYWYKYGSLMTWFHWVISYINSRVSGHYSVSDLELLNFDLNHDLPLSEVRFRYPVLHSYIESHSGPSFEFHASADLSQYVGAFHGDSFEVYTYRYDGDLYLRFEFSLKSRSGVNALRDVGDIGLTLGTAVREGMSSYNSELSRGGDLASYAEVMGTVVESAHVVSHVSRQIEHGFSNVDGIIRSIAEETLSELGDDLTVSLTDRLSSSSPSIDDIRAVIEGSLNNSPQFEQVHDRLSDLESRLNDRLSEIGEVLLSMNDRSHQTVDDLVRVKRGLSGVGNGLIKLSEFVSGEFNILKNRVSANNESISELHNQVSAFEMSVDESLNYIGHKLQESTMDQVHVVGECSLTNDDVFFFPSGRGGVRHRSVKGREIEEVYDVLSPHKYCSFGEVTDALSMRHQVIRDCLRILVDIRLALSRQNGRSTQYKRR